MYKWKQPPTGLHIGGGRQKRFRSDGVNPLRKYKIGRGQKNKGGRNSREGGGFLCPFCGLLWNPQGGSESDMRWGLSICLSEEDMRFGERVDMLVGEEEKKRRSRYGGYWVEEELVRIGL